MKNKKSRESIKAIMAKHGVKNATPAQMRAMLNFESHKLEIKNNKPCPTCGNKSRMKRGDLCFKCANNKHLVNAHNVSRAVLESNQ